MFEAITTDQSLYMLRDEDVGHFQSIARRHGLSEIEERRFFKPVDSWLAVMNVWCLLQEEDRDYQMNFDKMMAYSANFYGLSLIRKQECIWHYLAMKKDEDSVFLLAYYVTDELLECGEKLLEREEFGEEVIAKNRQQDYFSLFEDESLRLDENHDMYRQQKILANVLAHSYMTEGNFEEHIKKAIIRTKEYLESYMLHPTK